MRLLRALCCLAWWFVAADAMAQGLGGFVSPGALTRAHDRWSGVTNCTHCHTPGQGPTPDRCTKCHDSVREQIRSKTGFHKTRATNCGSCHPEHRGLDFELIPDLSLDPKFDHLRDTGWALEGEHARIRCLSCHQTPRDYVGLDPTCTSCHRDPHGGAQSQRTLLATCENCHDIEDWVPGVIPLDRFDHDDPLQADYPLEGEHADVACVECHIDTRFVGIAFDACTSCHVDTHLSPAIRARNCEGCHPAPTTWEVSDFDHSSTRYPLVGQHAGVGCADCHPGDKTEPISFDKCETCHTDVHDGQFEPKPCTSCHNVEQVDWKIPKFNHDKTRFPLVGKHREQGCADCHGAGPKAKYVKIPHGDCDSCHEDAHAGRFQPTPCATCHVPDGFDVQAFDHARTDFPHTGRHVGVACDRCHVPGKWTGVAHASCNDCHDAQNPHSTEMSAERCGDCHVTTGFKEIDFDHVGQTGFDLAPAHHEMPCSSCHDAVQTFTGLDPDCTLCHTEDVPRGHYPGACEDCHDGARWWPAGLGSLDHAETGFALQGAHSREPCEACHAPGVARGAADPGCISCHTRDDPHFHMLGDVCSDCHTDTTWFRTTFRHLTTGFALRGAHRLAACVDCHAAGYIGTPTECFRCHETEAICVGPDAARCAQAHASPQFAECDACHVVYTWTVGTDRFPH